MVLFLGILEELVYGKQSCHVLIRTIADCYVGNCKKGLVNGKGKASGVDNFVGTFRKGLPIEKVFTLCLPEKF